MPRITCTEGHSVETGETTCSEGHPISQGATAPQMLSISPADLQKIISSAVEGATKMIMQTSQPASSAPQTQSKKKAKRPDPVRPVIDLDSAEGDWEFFLSEWTRYKRQAELDNQVDVTDELQAACTKDLRKELFDFVGQSTLNTLDEDSLLAKIKAIAIKGKNKSVHRQEFYGMKQDTGQPIQAFVGKLKSKALHCDFTVKCNNTNCRQINSYAESMISDGSRMCRHVHPRRSTCQRCSTTNLPI